MSIQCFQLDPNTAEVRVGSASPNPVQSRAFATRRRKSSLLGARNFFKFKDIQISLIYFELGMGLHGSWYTERNTWVRGLNYNHAKCERKDWISYVAVEIFPVGTGDPRAHHPPVYKSWGKQTPTVSVVSHYRNSMRIPEICWFFPRREKYILLAIEARPALAHNMHLKIRTQMTEKNEKKNGEWTHWLESKWYMQI